jgi:galactokinase
MPDAASPTSSLPPFIRPPSSDPSGSGAEAAPRLLEACFGAGDTPIQTSTVTGVVDVQGAQTHYSTGFALMMPLEASLTVTCRRSDHSASRLVFAADAGPWTASTGPDDLPDVDAPVWHRLMHRLLHGTAEAPPPGWTEDSPAPCYDVAVVSSIPGSAQDAYFAALALAFSRAAGRAPDPSRPEARISRIHSEVLPGLCDAIEAATDRPTSIASLIAAHAGADAPFTLVDTGTYEFLPVETEARDALDWVVIDPGRPSPRPPAWHRSIRGQAEEALSRLRNAGFDGLRSFRNVEHRDLDRALDQLPERLRPVTRHLVTENRRVQKHVAAMRRGDWQMIGALLLMSHASLRDALEGTTDLSDEVVEAVESMMLDGAYGACMTSRDGLILVTGRPHALDNLLDAIPTTVSEAASAAGAELHTLRP